MFVFVGDYRRHMNIVTLHSGMVLTSAVDCADTLVILPHTNKKACAYFIALRK